MIAGALRAVVASSHPGSTQKIGLADSAAKLPGDFFPQPRPATGWQALIHPRAAGPSCRASMPPLTIPLDTIPPPT